MLLQATPPILMERTKSNDNTLLNDFNVTHS